MKHLTLLLLFAFVCNPAWAWGKRGHQIVGETAALVVSSEKGNEFMRGISYDFGYYSNVPDVVWKKPASYELERHQHFMDLEIFERAFKEKKDIGKPFELSRQEFEKNFPDVKPMAGRAFWRIKELVIELEKASKDLREFKEEKGKARQALQEKWINYAGPLGHYIGDLGMPLHVSENYDGQLTDQKGLHRYFEELMVDQLYPELLTKVNTAAKAQWPKFKKSAEGKTILQLVEDQSDRSFKAIPELLKLDKGRPRAPDSLKEAKRYEKLIVQQLTDASLVLAEIYRRNLGWKFDGDKFYFWNGSPEYIKPEVAAK